MNAFEETIAICDRVIDTPSVSYIQIWYNKEKVLQLPPKGIVKHVAHSELMSSIKHVHKYYWLKYILEMKIKRKPFFILSLA